MVINTHKTTNWIGTIIISVLLLALLGLVGCGSDETVPAIEEGAVEVAEVEVQATETAAALVEDVNSEEVEAVETAVAEAPIDECLACHIDKEMLIGTADPIEEVISENEGAG